MQNKRLVSAYCKKSKDLKEANQKVRALQEQQVKLHERIEELCCRYLNYKMKKHDEILELRTTIEVLKNYESQMERKSDISDEFETLQDRISKSLFQK